MLDLHRLLNVRVGQQNPRGITMGHVRPMHTAGSSSDNHCNHYACMLRRVSRYQMPVRPVPNAILTVTCWPGVALFGT